MANQHANFVYSTGKDEVSVPTISIFQNPPTAIDNVGIPAPDVTIRLYYSSDMGTTWTEMTSAKGATWTSENGDESCISWLDEKSKAFKLKCDEKTNY